MDRRKYDERLFGSLAIRRRHHEARFRWFARVLRRLGRAPESISALGCFDGRTIRLAPRDPSLYLGCDADRQGGGLTRAARPGAETPGFEFRERRSPARARPGRQTFDAAIWGDAFEHHPPAELPEYPEIECRAARDLVPVAVPNEKGLAFAAKRLEKAVLGGKDPYTLREAADALLCRTDRIARREHTGCDYAEVIGLPARRPGIESVSGIPFGGLPHAVNASTGIARGGRPVAPDVLSWRTV